MMISALRRFTVGFSVASLAVFFMTISHARPKPAASGYHLIKTISLPPAPGEAEYYDYITVDAAARRVYVSHGTEVVVLNADDFSVIGRVKGLTQSHGVAVVKDLGKGFITDGSPRESATVQEAVVFDLKTLKVTGRVKTAQPDTDAIVYEPVSKHIFTFNGDSHSSTVIDAKKESVITTIDLITKGEFPAADGKGVIFDNNPGKNEIVAIDARTNTIKSRWPSAPAGAPTSLAMDRKRYGPETSLTEQTGDIPDTVS